MIQFLMFLFLPLSLFAQFKIAVIGDSISDGSCATNKRGWVTLLSEDLQKEFGKDINVINKSVGGLTTESAKKIFYNLLVETEINTLILTLGINDANSGLSYDQIYDNLEEMINICEDNGINVLLGFVDPIYVSNSLHNQAVLLNFKYLYFDLFQQHPFITLFPFLSPPIMTKDEYHNLPDRIHPNDKGHEYIKKVVKYHLIGV